MRSENEFYTVFATRTDESRLRFSPNGDRTIRARFRTFLISACFTRTSVARSSSSVRAVGNVRKQMTMDRLESETKRSRHALTRNRRVSRRRRRRKRDLHQEQHRGRRKNLNCRKNETRAGKLDEAGPREDGREAEVNRRVGGSDFLIRTGNLESDLFARANFSRFYVHLFSTSIYVTAVAPNARGGVSFTMNIH